VADLTWYVFGWSPLILTPAAVEAVRADVTRGPCPHACPRALVYRIDGVVSQHHPPALPGMAHPAKADLGQGLPARVGVAAARLREEMMWSTGSIGRVPSSPTVAPHVGGECAGGGCQRHAPMLLQTHALCPLG
jgi:hypothetical protein